MITQTENTRFLAAVMFVDMVDYTARMQEDEAQAISLRNRLRQVLQAKVLKRGGKIQQYYGDGALITFYSAYESAMCAVEIQGELQQNLRVPVRIGIHLGDIVSNSDGVYGDAVNIASRIESLSVPGGILISDKIENELRNHANIKSLFVGTVDLKNVNRPIDLYTLKNNELSIPSSGIELKWQRMLSKQVTTELLHPYLINLNTGILN